MSLGTGGVASCDAFRNMSFAAQRPGGALRRGPPFSAAGGPQPCRQLALAALAVFLIAFGSRCWTIAAFGTDLPFWDQWDAEARELFLPWFSHHLAWSDLVRPHNEHRILLTRLIDLGLLGANGRWDSRLEAVVGALIQGALAGLMVRWTARDLSGGFRLGFAAAAAAAFSVPFAYENILGGFQLQMFLLLLISLVALHLLVTAAPFTPRSWAGLLAAALALGTMASGFLAAAATLPVLAWEAWHRPEARGRLAGLAAILAAIAAAGWASRGSVPEHAGLTAHSVPEFLWSLGRLAAWPRWRTAWTALVYPLPWLALMAGELRRRTAPSLPAKWMAVLGIWALLQLAALAYGRKPDPFPAPRYLDLLVLWQLINVAAALILCSRPGSPRARRWRLTGAGVWLAFLGIAYVPVINKDLRPELTGWRADSRLYEQNVRAYLRSDDPDWLKGRIPYPSASDLRVLLDDPALRQILPHSVAWPPVGEAWLSRWARRVAEAGPWFLAAGTLVFGLAAAGPRRTSGSCRVAS